MTKSKSNYSIFSLAFPIAIEFLFQRLFSIADTLVLSNYSDTAVASVGYADQILSISLLIFQVISSGTSILLAQAIGAKQKDAQTNVCTSSIFLSLILGAVTCIILLISRNALLDMLKVSPALKIYASDYLQIMAFGQIFSSIFFALTAIYRSYGKAYYTSTISIISNILNIVGDILVVTGILSIFNPVQDVAFVTVFAKLFSCLCTFILLLGKFRSLLTLSISRSTLYSVLSLGIPAAGESCSYKISQLICTTIIGSLGTNILTGKIYGMTFSSIMVLIPNSIAIAVGIIVGIYAGDNNLSKAKETVLSSIKIGSLSIVIIAVPFILLGKYIINSFYTTDPVIQKTAYFVLCAEALTMFIKNINLTLGNSLRAIKDVNYPVFISILSMWTIGTGLCWLLAVPANLGIIGIFTAFLVDESLRAFLLFRRWTKKTEL